jgi:hypothetical protein
MHNQVPVGMVHVARDRTAHAHHAHLRVQGLHLRSGVERLRRANVQQYPVGADELDLLDHSRAASCPSAWVR